MWLTASRGGTLLSYGGAQLPATLEQWDQWQHPSDPHLAKVVPALGPRLLAMPCDLMWVTAWMHDANAVIAPLLGLPELPVAQAPGTNRLMCRSSRVPSRQCQGARLPLEPD
jgi:hypothetical protein